VSAAAGQLTASRGYRVLVSVGLVSYGLVHLVLAWIALQVAFGYRGNASNSGALRQLASEPFGRVLMVVMGIGLLALVVWQGLEAITSLRSGEAKDRLKDGGRAVGRAGVYLALGVTAIRLAVGSGGGSGGSEQTVTARLLGVPFGRVLVIIVGLAVIAVGVSQIVKGVRRKFVRDDLRAGASPAVGALGTAGWVAKGVALLIIGALFGWAAITYDARKAGGMDAALGTLRSQPFGTLLLTVLALGIACFGVYCFAWAKNAKR
jgi:uncharacterized protein DUF1206